MCYYCGGVIAAEDWDSIRQRDGRYRIPLHAWCLGVLVRMGAIDVWGRR